LYDFAELIEEHPIIEGLVENYLWATRGRLTYPWEDLRRMLTLAEDDKERKLSNWISTCFIDVKNPDAWVTLPRFVVNQTSFLQFPLRYGDHISDVEQRTFSNPNLPRDSGRHSHSSRGSRRRILPTDSARERLIDDIAEAGL
jgi:hypothetical protein